MVWVEKDTKAKEVKDLEYLHLNDELVLSNYFDLIKVVHFIARPGDSSSNAQHQEDLLWTKSHSCCGREQQGGR